MKVKAKERGFYAGRRIRAGEVFVLEPGARPGSWMEVTDEAGTQAIESNAAEEPEQPAPRANRSAPRKGRSGAAKAS